MRRFWRRTAPGEEMACRELVAAITTYLDGELDPPQRDSIRRHLAECTGCSRVIDQFQRTIGALGQLSTDDVQSLDPAVRAELIEAFRASRSAGTE